VDLKEKLESNRTKWLSEHYRRRLDAIIEYTTRIWHNSATMPWFTLHDQRHSRHVEDFIYMLIPDDRYKQFEEYELFCLLASVWRHDIGMSIDVAGSDRSYESIRKEHHEASCTFVAEHQMALGLNAMELGIVTQLCRYHRKQMKIEELQFGEAKLANRIRLLAAYLRLADALHLDTTRAPEGERKTRLEAGMRWESELHWSKCRWVNHVEVVPNDFAIKVHLMMPASSEDICDAFSNLIRIGLQEELDSVRDVLIKGQISYFLEVVMVRFPSPGTGDLLEFEQIVSTLAWQDTASSSDLARGVMRSIHSIASNKDSRKAYDLLRKYHDGQLADLIGKRHYNYLLQRISGILEQAFRSVNYVGDDYEDVLENIKSKLSEMIRIRDEYINLLCGYAKSMLVGGKTILLFGFSRLTAKALSLLPDEEKDKTRLFICNASNKTQFTYCNELSYQDGIAYAKELAKGGFKNIQVIPDSHSGYLLKAHDIDLVVLGANGVNVSSKKFSHLAGVTAITEIATMHNVQVLILVDLMKFGHADSSGELVQRPNLWLTGMKKDLKDLEDHNILLSNPRTELVDLDCQNAFYPCPFHLVTNVGVFRGDRMPSHVFATQTEEAR